MSDYDNVYSSAMNRLGAQMADDVSNRIREMAVKYIATQYRTDPEFGMALQAELGITSEDGVEIDFEETDIFMEMCTSMGSQFLEAFGNNFIIPLD